MAVRTRFLALLLAGATVLAACDRLPFPSYLRLPEGADPGTAAATPAAREVEAPDQMSLEARALWDGRPSLGGVWVAHPDVDDPLRVRVTRVSDGSFVDGAMFRRERDLPGPPLQVSSDAAEALGLIAGQPTELRVVALQPVEDIAPGPSTATEARTERDRPEPRPLSRPFVQAATFNDAADARRVAESLREEGLDAIVRGGSGGTSRVLIGPLASEAMRKAARDRVVTLGYVDAYYVSD